MEGFCFSVGQVCVSLSGRFVYLLRGGFEKPPHTVPQVSQNLRTRFLKTESSLDKHLRNCSVFKKEEKAMYPLVVEIIQECHF